MSDPVKPRTEQKPVFIIEDFDSENADHVKGVVTMKINRHFATDLCRLIDDVDLDEKEKVIYAMRCSLRRWYDKRKENFEKKKASEAQKPAEGG